MLKIIYSLFRKYTQYAIFFYNSILTKKTNIPQNYLKKTPFHYFNAAHSLLIP